MQTQLDANRWFRNVEIGMLKTVGQETVRYVSNVNKYYVIYRNALERVEKREAAIERVKQKRRCPYPDCHHPKSDLVSLCTSLIAKRGREK